MVAPVTPATPSTPAQRERYDRVLTTASAVLSAGGEEALQMKDLAQRADVSLATLYRYFPSKDHVLLALSLSNYQAAVRKVLLEAPRGATVRERVTNHLLREFHQQILQHVAASGPGLLTERQRRVLPIIIDNFSSASRRWQTGVCSAAEARFQIRVGAHLLDLTDAELEAEQELAAAVQTLSPA
jgi:AcrR family transcriptional regulator